MKIEDIIIILEEGEKACFNTSDYHKKNGNIEKEKYYKGKAEGLQRARIYLEDYQIRRRN